MIMEILEELESQLARPTRLYQGYLFDLDGTIADSRTRPVSAE